MKISTYIALLFFGAVVFAQQKPLSTSINVRQNKIGAEFKLSLKAIADTSARVVFPILKNLGALEVIQSYPIDTVWKDSKYELVKTYGLTQEKLSLAKSDAIVLHPGPMNRGVEIDSEVADDPAVSLIQDQVEMGVAARMAVLASLAARLDNA